MLFRIAYERADGALRTFTSPVPGRLQPVLNGRTRSSGFVLLNNTQVTFDEAPRVGDVVGFYIQPVVVVGAK